MKMNEKYMLFILIVLTIITNSKYTVASSSSIITNVYDTKDTIAYWTPERMSNAIPMIKRIGYKNKIKIQDDNKDGSSVKALNNTTGGFLPVGRLFVHDPSSNQNYMCTASVIKTDNGNIGLTAGHCLFKYNNIKFTNMNFCPENNNGQCIPVKGSVLYIRNGNYYYDYGMIKFDGQGKLQDRIGSFDWDANPGDKVAVTIFGYPVGGEMQCAKNGKVLCMWQGNMFREGSFRYVPVDTGHGSSGGPWVKQYDPKTKSGWIVGSTSAGSTHSTNSPIYSHDEFLSLIQMAEKI